MAFDGTDGDAIVGGVVCVAVVVDGACAVTAAVISAAGCLAPMVLVFLLMWLPNCSLLNSF